MSLPFSLPSPSCLQKNQYPTAQEASALISMPTTVQLTKDSEAETEEKAEKNKNIFHLRRSLTTWVTFGGWGGGITKRFSKAQEFKAAQVIFIKRLKWIAHYLKSLRSLLI